MRVEMAQVQSPTQPSRSETETARSLLDQLLADSRLYTKSKDYQQLLEFVARMRNFAPFNAMLLQVQKPGLRFAASAFDWKFRFGRKPKEGSRPLLILWPFGPVALVYDVVDTEGEELPRDVFSFYAQGPVDAQRVAYLAEPLRRKNIDCCLLDTGDQRAGSIRVLTRAANDKAATTYRLCVNRNHDPPVQFTTVAHELAHLFLGHLGPDKKLKVPERPRPNHRQAELEAESVAYLVCARNGVQSASETYLKDYVRDNTTIDQIDVYQVMRAAGRVEALLGLTEHARFEPRNRRSPAGKPIQQQKLFSKG